MTRVVLADDQALIREGLRLIFDLEGIEVVGEAASGRDALDVIRGTQPDVALMDVQMPGMNGIEATRLVPAASQRTRVLVLTTFDLDEYVYDAVRAGASGFLLKSADRAQLVAGVRTIAAGDALLAPAITRRLLERFARRPPPGQVPDVLAQLTERELAVMRLVAKGRSNQEIADDLVLGVATVKTHVARTLQKLGARDRIQLVIAAYESGLVEPGDHDLTG